LTTDLGCRIRLVALDELVSKSSSALQMLDFDSLHQHIMTGVAQSVILNAVDKSKQHKFYVSHAKVI
jgi:hypothetical protein